MNLDKDKIWKGIQDDPRMLDYNQSSNGRKPIWIILVVLAVVAIAYVAIFPVYSEEVSENTSESDEIAEMIAGNSDSEGEVDEIQLIEVNNIAETSSQILESPTSKDDENSNSFEMATTERVEKNNLNDKVSSVVDQVIYVVEPEQAASKVSSQTSSGSALAFADKESRSASSMASSDEVKLVPKQKKGFEIVKNDEHRDVVSAHFGQAVEAKSEEPKLFSESLIDGLRMVDLLLKNNVSLTAKFDETFALPKKRTRIHLAYFLQGGYGFSNATVKLESRENKLLLDDYHQNHYALEGKAGTSFTYGAFEMRLEAIYQQLVFKGVSALVDTSYTRNSDNSLTKRENMTEYTLYQKYSTLGVGVAISYNLQLSAWSINPYLGMQLGALAMNDISMLSQTGNEFDVKQFSPSSNDRFSYSAGLRINRFLGRKSLVYADLGTSFGNDFIAEDFFSVSIIPVFVSVGVQRPFR